MAGKSDVKVNITTSFDATGAKVAERELRRVAQMQMRAQGEMAAAEARAAAARKEALGTVSRTVTAMGLAMTAFGVLAVAASSRFDAAMSAVAATGQDAKSNLDALSEAALEAGARTQYSATEAAAAIENLAKAGLSASTILSGALDGSLDLAAAGTMDVAEAAEITATALVQFGLRGDQARRVADLLAAGAGKAMGEVSDLGMALSYVGPVAAQLGVSIEETTGTLALFAQNGILAEKAGTGLRGVIMSLTAPSAAAAKTMDELGIQVFDSSGRFIGLSVVAEQLRLKLGPLSEATRSAALGQMFGNAQITAARVLYQGGAAAVDEWTDAVDEAGYAQAAAATKMDNLKGDVEELGGAFETWLIRLGSSADAPLRGVVQGVTGVVESLGDMPPAAQSALMALIGGGGVLSLSAGAAMQLTSALGQARIALQALGWTAGKVTLATAGIAAVVMAAGMAVMHFAKAHAEAKQRAEDYAATLDAETRAITTNTRAVAANHLEKAGALEAAQRLGIDAGMVVDAVLGEAAAYRSVTEALDALRGTTDMTAQARMQMFGDRDAIEGAIRRESHALRESQAAAGREAEAIGETADAHRGATGAIEEQVDALKDLITVAAKAAGVVLSERDAQRNLEQAYADATKAIEENGQTLDITTEKGRDNQAALDDIADSAWDLVDSMRETGRSQQDIQAQMSRSRERFLAAAQAMGMSADEANTLADELGMIPETITTRVSTPGLDEAIARAQLLAETVRGIPAQKTVTINGQVRTVNLVALTPGSGAPIYGKGYSAGGPVRGTGAGTVDSVPAMLAPGEHVWTAAEVAGAGGHAAVEAMRRAAAAYAVAAPSVRAASVAGLVSPAPSSSGAGTGGAPSISVRIDNAYGAHPGEMAAAITTRMRDAVASQGLRGLAAGVVA